MSLVIEEMPDLGVTRLSRWIFNCYVLHSGDGAVVVDAGLPRVASDLATVLERLGATLHAVVATHGHSDHVAGAAELAARHRAPIWLPVTTLTYLDGAKPLTPTPSRIARIWPTLIDQPLDRVGVAGLLSGARLAGYGTAAGMRWTGPPPAVDSPTASRCRAHRIGWCSTRADTPMTASRCGMRPPGRCCPVTPYSPHAARPGTRRKSSTP